MKTLYTLSTIILMALSLNTLADDKVKSKDRSTAVSAAPFTWGDPDSAAPAHLSSLKAKNALVPVAPFIWGAPEEVITDDNNANMAVPVAPFTYGNADAEAPVGLELIKAVNADVPVAPFVLGEPSDVPVII